jgi:hypothetical protein
VGAGEGPSKLVDAPTRSGPTVSDRGGLPPATRNSFLLPRTSRGKARPPHRLWRPALGPQPNAAVTLRARFTAVANEVHAAGGAAAAGWGDSAAGAMRSAPPHREAGKRAQRFVAASSVIVIRVDLMTTGASVRLAYVAQTHPYSPRLRQGMSWERFPGARSGAGRRVSPACSNLLDVDLAPSSSMRSWPTTSSTR